MEIKDVAIIYQARIYDAERLIETLNKIGIRAKKYTDDLEAIKAEVREQVANYNSERTNEKLYLKDLNAIYNNGLAKLEMLLGRMQKYNGYIKGYSYCEYLDSRLNGEKVSEDELNEYVSNIIMFTNLINNTDTRDYEEEREIVEKVYKLAYQVMKLEFVVLGKSRIFDAAKSNPVIESFISNSIFEDITNLENKGKCNKLINERINKIQSEGVNSSYLDKILITSIALEGDRSIAKRIADDLKELSETVKANNKELIKLKVDITEDAKVIDDRKSDIKGNNIDNAIIITKRIVTLAAAIGIIFGCSKLAKLITKDTKYKTTSETFSSMAGYSREVDYESIKSKDTTTTKLYVYQPCVQDDYEHYHRNYIVYDINNISEDCKTLDDYLNLNLAYADSVDTGYEDMLSSDMTEEDFNDEIMYKVVKVIQDLDDTQVEYDKASFWFFTVLLSFLGESLLFLIVNFDLEVFDNTIFDELIGNNGNHRAIKKKLIEIKNKFETFRKLIDNNKEVKEEFSRLYSEVRPLMEIPEFASKIEKFNDAIQIDDPQIELDKRILRKIKTRGKVKGENNYEC